MEAPALPKRVYRFGLFQVDADGGRLFRQAVPVKLQQQPLRVLCLLLARPGEIVSREELRATLWPEGTYVEFDGSLNAALKRLRYALGDDADNPIFIETVPKRGYRFVAPVAMVASVAMVAPVTSGSEQVVAESASGTPDRVENVEADRTSLPTTPPPTTPPQTSVPQVMPMPPSMPPSRQRPRRVLFYGLYGVTLGVILLAAFGRYLVPPSFAANRSLGLQPGPHGSNPQVGCSFGLSQCVRPGSG